ncbi:Fe-S cluster assembly sulfur transfer protein SufU [Azospirillum sp. A26]|uniref:SUF system NifU family Fe-S cluster assembly protein n=2 Tax=Azospirillum TaxID=191 RepID=A0A2B8BDM5_9PROT|nr:MULTISPECIES: SUF system NifU family Fe-S cluster assembly protein [Azospirillum]KAA0589025.1 SUF system NifU family Fe-S cluster assembly protein [Azospirillum lipoferum]MCP1612383.1 nitrogen fixation NifU-like protein [Azospirillum lipoferum]MDW5531833.1 SUF system NifU family Fe-S cluster assembly protein [Azospirillum sp. NL1]PGH55472.1 SUF system NifU family Fe-S cluster assembly protein [Azospirillum palustre]PWC78933.1 nitrogen fixation protein NifU [Azospirillum sp. TSH64]
MMDDLRELYQEVILDHGKHPRNFRHPDDANREAKGENPMCGDRFMVYLTLKDGVVDDVAFQGRGCAISTASASMMTELVHGKTAAEAEKLFHAFHELCTQDEPDIPEGVDDETMEKLMVMSGVRQFPVRVKCATLAWHAMNAALHGEASASSDQF